ncbi:hypothetical protein [Natrinema sp. SYSU A 869]|uniref:hypothetical protein n=1 Tax=Natrinema sp. SYSU A 869 TaxID=2871694 RepID=UPI001CA3F2CC|nr:hypothetical protein [Natrinema sp. SYSU A 869]
MGRVTYEGLSSVCPFETGDFDDYVNGTPKIVFSRQPREVEWGPGTTSGWSMMSSTKSGGSKDRKAAIW